MYSSLYVRMERIKHHFFHERNRFSFFEKTIEMECQSNQLPFLPERFLFISYGFLREENLLHSCRTSDTNLHFSNGLHLSRRGLFQVWYFLHFLFPVFFFHSHTCRTLGMSTLVRHLCSLHHRSSSIYFCWDTCLEEIKNNLECF